MYPMIIIMTGFCLQENLGQYGEIQEVVCVKKGK
jgi:hypothetical protein